MKLLKAVFPFACAAALVVAILFERHEVVSLSEKGKKSEDRKQEAVKVLSGLGFTDAATVDGFLREAGVLYDVYSLHAISNQADFKLDVQKACPT